MAENRDNQLRIIEALIAPQTVYDFILALNTPDDRSPYKKKLVNEIIKGVSMEVLLEELQILFETTQKMTEERRREKIREWRDEESYEMLQTSQATQFKTEKENELKVIAMRMDIDKRIEYLNEIVKEESPKKEEYKQTVTAAKEELKAIEHAWEAREQNCALKFIEAYKNEHHYPAKTIGGMYPQIGFKQEDEKRLKKAFTTASPKKLLKINAEVLNEVGDDKEQLSKAAETMAAKGDYVRTLQVLTELSRIHQPKQKHHDEYVPKPSDLKRLCKRYKLHTKPEKDKEDIFNAIKKRKQLKVAKEKLLLLDNAEKLLKHAEKERQANVLMITSGKAK